MFTNYYYFLRVGYLKGQKEEEEEDEWIMQRSEEEAEYWKRDLCSLDLGSLGERERKVVIEE